MPIQPQKPRLLTINQFAILCETTPRTVRFYALKGLLKPIKVDQSTNYRYYDPLQARKFFQIKLLQDFHITLSQAKEAMLKANKNEFLKDQLKYVKAELQEKKKEYQFLKLIKEFLFSGQSGRDFMKEESIGPYLLLCKLEEKGRYDQINTVIFELIAQAKKLKIPTNLHQLVFYLDAEAFKPNDTKLEICLICQPGVKEGDIDLPEGYYFRRYAKTTVRTYTYRGPFEYLALIYQKIHENHRTNHLKKTDLGFDLYLKGPWNATSEYDHLTKVCFIK